MKYLVERVTEMRRLNLVVLLVSLIAYWFILDLLLPRAEVELWKSFVYLVGGGLLLGIVLKIAVNLIEKDIRGQ